MSSCAKMSFSTVPGDHARPADERRYIAALPVGVLLAAERGGAPSGQVNFSAPLSVEYITMVLSARPSSCSASRSDRPARRARPCRRGRCRGPSCRATALQPRQMCMRVEFRHRKNGLPAVFASPMKRIVSLVISSSMVSMRFLSAGRCSRSSVCRPGWPRCGGRRACRTSSASRGPEIVSCRLVLGVQVVGRALELAEAVHGRRVLVRSPRWFLPNCAVTWPTPSAARRS